MVFSGTLHGHLPYHRPLQTQFDSGRLSSEVDTRLAKTDALPLEVTFELSTLETPILNLNMVFILMSKVRPVFKSYSQTKCILCGEITDWSL